MNWETVAQIATTVGELAAAAALVSGFILYRISRRDDYVADFKRTLALIRARFHHLDELMTYELIGEVVRSVVFSRDLEVPLKRLFDKFFAAESTAGIREYMKHTFPAIAVAVHSPLVDSYESILTEIDSDLANYQTDFPALYRVCLAVRTLLGNMELALKRTATRDSIWEELIPEIFEKEKAKQHDLASFKDRIAQILLGFAHEAVREKGQRRINNALALLDMVADAYLALPERRVLRCSRRERGTKMTPVKDTETLTEDLREAEKALKTLLAQEDVLRYRELVTLLEAPAA